MRRALTHPEGLAHLNLEVAEEALRHLAAVCEGDARKALNALEVAALTTEPDDQGVIHIHLAEAEESIQKKAVIYDRDGDEHYNTISAFIKSVRGSDPDAAIYWLAKMLTAGEDPRFIARRLIILASEDIGNADPRALSLATAALQAVEHIGMPEAQLTLSQTTAYLATAPKSNAATLAIGAAMKDVKSGKVHAVPDHLKDAHYSGAKQLGHTGYQYAHDHPYHFVDQEYAPLDRTYYEPTDLGYEKTIKERMAFLESLRASSSWPPPSSS
jgi:putative ATPase